MKRKDWFASWPKRPPNKLGLKQAKPKSNEIKSYVQKQAPVGVVPLHQVIAEIEFWYLVEAMRQANGVKSVAAKLCGELRTTFIMKLQKYFGQGNVTLQMIEESIRK